MTNKQFIILNSIIFVILISIPSYSLGSNLNYSNYDLNTNIKIVDGEKTDTDIFTDIPTYGRRKNIMTQDWDIKNETYSQYIEKKSGLGYNGRSNYDNIDILTQNFTKIEVPYTSDVTNNNHILGPELFINDMEETVSDKDSPSVFIQKYEDFLNEIPWYKDGFRIMYSSDSETVGGGRYNPVLGDMFIKNINKTSGKYNYIDEIRLISYDMNDSGNNVWTTKVLENDLNDITNNNKDIDLIIEEYEMSVQQAHRNFILELDYDDVDNAKKSGTYKIYFGGSYSFSHYDEFNNLPSVSFGEPNILYETLQYETLSTKGGTYKFDYAIDIKMEPKLITKLNNQFAYPFQELRYSSSSDDVLRISSKMDYIDYPAGFLGVNQTGMDQNFEFNFKFLGNLDNLTQEGVVSYDGIELMPWQDFYHNYSTTDNENDLILDLVDSSFILTKEVFEQNVNNKENFTYNIPVEISSENFEGLNKDTIFMEANTFHYQKHYIPEQQKRRLHSMTSFISLDDQMFPYNFDFRDDLSKLKIGIMGQNENIYSLKFNLFVSENTLIDINGKKITIKLNDEVDFKPLDGTELDIKAGNNEIELKVEIPDDVDKFKLGIDDITVSKQNFLSPEIVFNFDMLFSGPLSAVREDTSSANLIIQVPLYTTRNAKNKQIWWRSNNINNNVWSDNFNLDTTFVDKLEYISPISSGNKIYSLYISNEFLISNELVDGYPLNLEFAFSNLNSTPPVDNSTTISLIHSNYNGSVILPKPPKSSLDKLVTKIIILVSVITGFIIMAFGLGIGLLIRSNKNTRLVIGSMDKDVFSSDDIEDDFELVL